MKNTESLHFLSSTAPVVIIAKMSLAPATFKIFVLFILCYFSRNAKVALASGALF